MSEEKWPPSFTLDQEEILNLLTGDRFYSNPSAALREAVLNAIDAVHRSRKMTGGLSAHITATFNRDDLTVTVADNGIGMSQADVSALFTKVGASADTAEAKKDQLFHGWGRVLCQRLSPASSITLLKSSRWTR